MKRKPGCIIFFNVPFQTMFKGFLIIEKAFYSTCSVLHLVFIQMNNKSCFNIQVPELNAEKIHQDCRNS